MADESVRSLLATLGFEVDNTGADKFEARFKKLGTTIGTIATKINKINPKFNKKKGIERGKSFGAAVKKAFLTAVKLDKTIPGFDPKFKPGKGQEKARKIGKRIKESFLKALKIVKLIPGFDPKFKPGKGPKRASTFGEKIKIAFLKGLKIEEEGFNKFTKSVKTGLSKTFTAVKKTAISGASGIAKVIRNNIKFKSLPELEKSLGKSLNKAFKKAKITALAGAAALAAIVGKGFLKFTDVQSAKFALRFQAENLGVDFDKILDQLKKVKEETGGVIDELDILQALNVGFQLTNNMENVAKNMEQVIKFASILNKDASEVQQLISGFITTGETTGLRKLGFFTQEELEAQRRSGTGFETLSEKARTGIIDIKLAEQVARLEKAFKEFGGTNAAFIAKMQTIFSESLVKLGDETTTSIKKVVESDDVIGLLKKGISQTKEEFLSDIKAFTNFVGITEETPREIIKEIARPKGQGVGTFKQLGPTSVDPPNMARIIINQTVNNGDPVAVKKAAAEGTEEGFRRSAGKWVKDTAQMEIRKAADKGIPLAAQ